MYRVWTVLASLLVVAGLTISVLAQDKDKDKVVDKPVTDKPVTDKPVTDKPATDKDTPPKDTPPKDTPKDTPPKDTPPKDTPPKDTPPKDTPPKDTPPKDTPKKDTPPKDTPPKDTPPKDKPEERKPLSFEIKVPAETSIKIGDYQTTTTGTVRPFTTPPALVGKVYTFTIEATYKGKTVKKTLDVSSDKPASLDLTPEFIEKLPDKPKEKLGSKYDRKGFVTVVDKNNWLWIFKDPSKELDEFKKTGTPPEKIVTRTGGPDGLTIKAVDGETIDDYNKAK